MGAQVWEPVSQFGKPLVSCFASGQRGQSLSCAAPIRGLFQSAQCIAMVSYQLKRLHLITSFDSNDPI